MEEWLGYQETGEEKERMDFPESKVDRASLENAV